MRTALLITVLALALGSTPIATAATTPSKNPTKAQIKAAVQAAESSTSLWATVNVCNSKAEPDTLGVRGEMPTLGFPAWLSMKIQLNYYSKQRKRFLPDPGGTQKMITLGRLSTGLQQGGALFTFKPHAGLLNATVTFIWKRSGKLLGQKKLTTTAGHPTADFGSPPHYSAAKCRIP